MARYYDLDSLRVSDINVGTIMFPRMERCILLKDIESAPTADVVPKSVVIDEFAERLKKYYDSLKGQAPSTAIIVYHIDQIAKEMKEKNNGNEN